MKSLLHECNCKSCTPHYFFPELSNTVDSKRGKTYFDPRVLVNGLVPVCFTFHQKFLQMPSLSFFYRLFQRRALSDILFSFWDGQGSDVTWERFGSSCE